MDKLLENISISIYEKNKNYENEEDNVINKRRITLSEAVFSKITKKKKKFC